jgi:hypothetical protein
MDVVITANFRISRVLAVAAFLAAALLPISLGLAKASEVPPGFAVVDQYTEAFPGAGGDKTPPSGDGQDRPAKFPQSTVSQFTQAGSDGVAALSIAAAGSSEASLAGPQSKKKMDGKRRQAGEDQSAPAGGSKEVAKQVFGVAGSDGMGVFLPLIMVAALLLGGLYVVRRKRFAL